MIVFYENLMRNRGLARCNICVTNWRRLSRTAPGAVGLTSYSDTKFACLRDYQSSVIIDRLIKNLKQIHNVLVWRAAAFGGSHCRCGDGGELRILYLISVSGWELLRVGIYCAFLGAGVAVPKKENID